MTAIYVDTLATTDGTGSKASPHNTPANITVSADDTVFFKSGTTIDVTDLPADILAADRVTIGAYGSGDAPIFSGGVVRSDWVADAVNGVWYIDLGSNIAGNVVEDGLILDFVAWNTNVATTAAAMSAGSYSFDHVAYRLYIKPSNGTPAAHAYIVSESLYGFGSSSLAADVVIRDIELRHISRHGFFLFNKPDILIDSVKVKFAGGFRSGSYNLGNGIELSFGTDRALVRFCEFEDIFDSGGTTQLYDVSTKRVHSHIWYHNKALRCGSSAIEISCQTNNQTIESVIVDGLVANNISRDGFSGNRNGAAVVLLNQDASCKITNCEVRNVTATKVARGVACSRTVGRNRLMDIAVSDHSGFVATSTNTQAGEVIQWHNVVGDAGIEPTGGVFAEVPGLALPGSVLSL